MYATSTVNDLIATSLSAWIIAATLIFFLAFLGTRR